MLEGRESVGGRRGVVGGRVLGKGEREGVGKEGVRVLREGGRVLGGGRECVVREGGREDVGNYFFYIIIHTGPSFSLPSWTSLFGCYSVNIPQNLEDVDLCKKPPRHMG